MSADFIIRRYSSSEFDHWNQFIEQSANATFLHDRRFMEYHADRFEDHSLLIEKAGNLVAVLPANQSNDILKSHGGLTYGGLLVPPRFAASDMLEVVAVLKKYFVRSGIHQLVYKPTPHIFHSQPSESDIYALVNAGAVQTGAELATVIPMHRRIPFNSLRKRSVKKALKAGLDVREVKDFASYWKVLSDVLGSRHEAAPTHSLEEIELLASRFPDKIRLFATYREDTMLSGIVIFDFGPAVHAQYIASSDQGRELGALDLLVHELLENTFSDRDWFSFGTSTLEAGRVLNKGLSRQKEMFGGHSVAFSRYEWNI